ncbi:uncharacterized protein LOC132749302 [Ruditapes philippinarum]|uniref:uncharacterized protein LOC132749302 n=1 Tax=Ruditapes philippinarum TaxID=129788 RepID=UPI00295C2336|nr:uncharacterized protein LOC132749302 [Ruditapes philippinarum]
MFQAPHNREQLSLMLSDVLDDLGVNERIVKKRRKLMEMEESMSSIAWVSTGRNGTFYILGSQTEGTTTMGLNSDIDYVACYNYVNVIQDLSEWELGKENYLMIQDENTTPGYCFIQLLSSDPFPATEIPDDHQKSERRGILCKNTIKNSLMHFGTKQHGPAVTKQGHHNVRDVDTVFAYPCKSWPQSASAWLERQGTGWPTNEMRKCAAKTRCFVVPVESKISVYPELEWRISTSLAEKYLMFNFNITQIRCYVVLKMILKSFLNPKGEINISSFMIKTVLFHCIENTEPSIWVDNNLWTCIICCLQELHSCVQNEHCSHFIISENNLMAGQFTSETNHELSGNISDFIQNDRHFLLRIDTDDLGYRLKIKLNMGQEKVYSSLTSLGLPALLYINFAFAISRNLYIFFRRLHHTNIENMLQVVNELVSLMTNIDTGERHNILHTEVNFLAPFIFTTYGSALASSSFGKKTEILPEALDWLRDGLSSDVSSGRLKLASVFYSKGEMEKADEILRQTEQEYHSHYVVPICSCVSGSPETVSEDIARVCNEHNEDCIQNITAFCVQFIQQEINCVPHELQYEMFRSTQDDMIHRDPEYDVWMDWATVDSLPFLYLLQYKIYSHLQRQQEKQQALNNLIRTTFTEKTLKHRETALNILGQCMEQENRPNDAFYCYIYSLKERTRNNAAKIHICRLLCKCYMVLRFYFIIRKVNIKRK